MSEPGPVYDTVVLGGEVIEIEHNDLPDWMRAFCEGERRRTIAKLRGLDRMLGRRQTIPERVR